MSEETEPTPEHFNHVHVDGPAAYTATVTYLVEKTVEVKIPVDDFQRRHGPAARAGVAGRVDSLATGYVTLHRDKYPEIPADATITRVDVTVKPF